MIAWRHINPGMTVYHSLYPRMGAGKVHGKRRMDELGYRTCYTILVEFPDKGVKRWFRMEDLKKTKSTSKRSREEIRAIGPFIPLKK